MTDSNDELPLVTAIIPSYNRPKRTRRAIRSVVNQSYEQIELIVVDDNSTPPVEETICDEYTELTDFRLIVHEKNRGANAARNTGIEAASGEYIAFLDSDDEWTESKIEKQIIQFQSAKTTTGAVYTGVRQVNEDGETNSVDCPEKAGEITRNLLLWNFIGTFSCVMVRSSVFDSINQLDERFPSWQDWEFYLRISKEHDFGTVPEPLVVRHNDNTDQISSQYRQKCEQTFPLFREKFERLAASFGMLFTRKWRAYLSYHMALSAFRNQKYTEGRKWLCRSFRWYPLISSVYIHFFFALGGGWTYEKGRELKRRVIRITE